MFLINMRIERMTKRKKKRIQGMKIDIVINMKHQHWHKTLKHTNSLIL